MPDIEDPRYLIAPGLVNFTKWSRENIPKGPPAFKEGDRVLIADPLYVLIVGEDCDGTPLFTLSRENPADLNESERKRLSDWVFTARHLSAESLKVVEGERAPDSSAPKEK